MKEHPFWWDSPGLRPGGGALEGGRQQSMETSVPGRADVAIVGAGYTGLAAAYQLAKSGASVAVLEGGRIGSGASSRNGGQVLTGTKLDPHTLVARFGEERARQLFDVSLDAIALLEGLIAGEAMACDYARTGHVQAASKPAHFDAFREEQALLARVFHHQVDVVFPSEQRREIGSDAYHGLLIDERSGALNPALYVAHLGAAAGRAGATIVEGAAVKGMERRASTWHLATGRGVIQADEVLVATNGYTDRSAPWLQRRFVPIGSYLIATAPLTEREAAALIPKGRMVFDSKHFLHYYRLTSDRRLLFGGRAEFTRSTARSNLRSAEILRRDMLAIFPSLAAVPIEYAWGGNVAFTRDQMPHAGRLNGAYYAGGYGGHGVAMATYLGTAIARRMAGEVMDDRLFDDRFAPIPFYRGTPWFLPFVGAYYRVLDWFS